MSIYNKRSRKSSTVSGFCRVIIFILFALYAVSMIYPFVWAFLSSLKGQMEYYKDKFSLPKDWLFDNYALAFTTLSANGKNMFLMLFNSVWFAFGGTLLSVASSVMVAYVVAKYRFVGRRTIYRIALLIMMIPIVGSLPSQFLVFYKLKLYDSPLILLSYTGGFGFNFIILYAYFKSLPWSYAEAGYMDGAGHFTIFFRIMLPQALSSVTALSLIAFIGIWNDYMSPILFLPSYPTLSAGLYTYQQEFARNLNYPLLFAGVLMSTAPVLIIFIVFQNTLMDMTITGGIKE